MSRFSIPAALLALMLLIGLMGTVAAQEATPEAAPAVAVLAPNEPAYGVSPGEWYARWWQWTVSFPDVVNPNLDETGAQCGYGQHGPVFFLPRTFAETAVIDCTAPLGTTLLVPVAGAECSTVEEPPYFGGDPTELRECAAAWTDTIGALGVTVNGQEVMAIDTYRVVSAPFNLNFAAGNIYGVPPGVALSVADGYIVMLASLPEGDHTIDVFADFADGTPFTATTYNVSVQGPQVIQPAEEVPEETPTEDATPAVATPATA